MAPLVAWQELPQWVPGDILRDSDGLDWGPVAARTYHYRPQDVIVPAMEDFMIVAYRDGVTPMQRRCETRWKRSTLGPGAASLLTRAQPAQWAWEEPVEVNHIYLAPELVSEVAHEVTGRSVGAVVLSDVLRTEDPMMTWAGEALAREAEVDGLGGGLYVESVARALIVHLLRSYASVLPKELVVASGGLTTAQRKTLEGWVETRLSQVLRLDAMAEVLGLTPCVFARLFRQSYGRPPYAFVIERRVTRARQLLRKTRLPIKQIAVDCGFSDQPHMTRLFRRTLGVTPAQYRRASST